MQKVMYVIFKFLLKFSDRELICYFSVKILEFFKFSKLEEKFFFLDEQNTSQHCTDLGLFQSQKSTGSVRSLDDFGKISYHFSTSVSLCDSVGVITELCLIILIPYFGAIFFLRKKADIPLLVNFFLMILRDTIE